MVIAIFDFAAFFSTRHQSYPTAKNGKTFFLPFFRDGRHFAPDNDEQGPVEHLQKRL